MIPRYPVRIQVEPICDIAVECPCDVAATSHFYIAATSPGDLEATSHCDIAKRNHLGREGGRSDVAATFVKVAAMSLRPPCDLKFLLGSINSDQHKSVFVDQRL